MDTTSIAEQQFISRTHLSRSKGMPHRCQQLRLSQLHPPDDCVYSAPRQVNVYLGSVAPVIDPRFDLDNDLFYDTDCMYQLRVIESQHVGIGETCKEWHGRTISLSIKRLDKTHRFGIVILKR